MLATLGAVAFTLSMFIFAPRFDVPGALISLAAGMTVWTGSMIVDMAKRGQLNIFFSIVKPGIALLLGLGAFFGLHVFNTWLALFSGLIVLFGGAILSGGLSSQEREVFKSLFQKKTS
jgi:O-antigen/teichoic acid export membrane protein